MHAYVDVQKALREERHANAVAADEIHQLETQVGMLADRVASLEVSLRESESGRERERTRAEQLATALRRIHAALYSGDVVHLILRAALQITGAERGYYLTGTNGDLRVAASENVDGAVGKAPSPFIAQLAERVRESGEPVRWAQPDLPVDADPGPNEFFGNGLAVPVVVRGHFHGVIIALEKPDGHFDEQDLESLLAIGGTAEVAVHNARVRDEINHAFVTTLTLLADVVEAKDPYTRGHCERVSRYARATSDRLALSDTQRRVACYAALLHDIGKIGVSDGILNKPGPLLHEERELMQAHVRIGHDLLTSIPLLRDVAQVVLHHHEWFDGSGYPDGLSGDAIPIEARVVSVVDAFCAMLDRRSYKEASSPEEARAELKRAAGSQFDPAVVDAALAAIDQVDREEAMGSIEDHCGLFPGIHGPRPASAAAA